MIRARRRYDSEFKAQVVLEAVRGEGTIKEIAGRYGIHPHQVSRWKKQLLDLLPEAFRRGGEIDSMKPDEPISKLQRQVDQLKAEVEWLRSKTKPKAKD